MSSNATIGLTRLRRGWRSFIPLVLLIGAVGGLTLGGIAGARRTASAPVRFTVTSNSSDVLVNPDNGTDSALDVDDLRALPGVNAVGRADGTMLLPPGELSVDRMEEVMNFAGGLTTDGSWGYDIDAPSLTAGRMPDRDDPVGIFVEHDFAEREGLEVGDRYEVRVPTGEQVLTLFTTTDPDLLDAQLKAPEFAPPVSLMVRGIGRTLDSIQPEASFEPIPVLFTPAFWARHGQPGAGWWGAMVDLEEGADLDAFRAAASALTGPDDPLIFQTTDATIARLERAASPFGVALTIFAAVSGLLGLLLLGQAMSRRLQEDAPDNEAWSAMGATRFDRAAMSMIEVAVVCSVGAVVAVAVAVLASPLTPLGPARLAEPDPGLSFDAWVLFPGLFLVAAVTVVASVVPAWSNAQLTRNRVSAPSGRGARWVGRMALPVPISTGVRFAIDSRRGPDAVPTRSTMLGAGTAVVVAVVVAVIAASLGNLVDTPRLFGSDWDMVARFSGEVDEESTPTLITAATAVRERLEQDPSVAHWSPVVASQITIDGSAVNTVTFLPTSKPVTPTIVAGRAPEGPDEVAVGRLTMDRLGLDIGDQVDVDVDSTIAKAVIVGQVILPEFAEYSGSDKTALGEGVLLADPTIDFVDRAEDANTVVIDTAPEVTTDEIDGLLTESIGEGFAVDVGPVDRPSDVTSMAQLRDTPVVMASVLLVLIAFSVCHALIVAARRRRKDLAILQAFGATRGAVRTVLVTQGLTVALIAGAVGVPIGLLAAGWTWRQLMGLFGALAEPSIPYVALLILGVVTLLLAVLTSLWPAHRALGVSPAEALATE